MVLGSGSVRWSLWCALCSSNTTERAELLWNVKARVFDLQQGVPVDRPRKWFFAKERAARAAVKE
jgi:hypothetical protein